MKPSRVLPLTASLAVAVVIGLLAGSPPAAAQGNSLWQGFGPSSSQSPRQHPLQRKASQSAQRGGISAGEAASIVRQSGAKVLEVRRTNGSYRVKALTPKGRVRTVWVDARTGRISR